MLSLSFTSAAGPLEYWVLNIQITKYCFAALDSSWGADPNAVFFTPFAVQISLKKKAIATERQEECDYCVFFRSLSYCTEDQYSSCPVCAVQLQNLYKRLQSWGSKGQHSGRKQRKRFTLFLSSNFLRNSSKHWPKIISASASMIRSKITDNPSAKRNSQKK